MAKAAAAPEAPPAPAPAETVATPPRGDNGRFLGSPKFGPAGAAPDVITWNPVTSTARFDAAEGVKEAPAPGTVDADVPDEEATPAKPAPAAKPGKAPRTPPQRVVEADAPPAEGDAEEAPPDEPGAAAAVTDDGGKAARLAKIRESLAKERTKLAVEDAARAAQEEAKALREQLDRLKKGGLPELFKFVGKSRQEVEDALLLGHDSVAEPAGDAPAAGVSPEVAELRAKLEKLEARDQERANSEQSRAVAQVVGQIQEQLKDAPIHAIRVTRGGYNRVMTTAHDAWLASGKSGTTWDYLADAAALVEEDIRTELKTENPDLLAYVESRDGGAAQEEAGDAEAEEETPAPPPKPKAPVRTAVGRRAVATTKGKPSPLPVDRDERLKEIKRRFGWLQVGE